MTACWVTERLYWLFVKNGFLLDPNFGKIISGNMFDHRDNLGVILGPLQPLFEKIISENIFNTNKDTLGIVLTPISGL